MAPADNPVSFSCHRPAESMRTAGAQKSGECRPFGQILPHLLLRHVHAGELVELGPRAVRADKGRDLAPDAEFDKFKLGAKVLTSIGEWLNASLRG